MWKFSENKKEDLPGRQSLRWKSVFQVSYRMFLIISIVLLIGFLIWAELEFGLLNLL